MKKQSNDTDTKIVAELDRLRKSIAADQIRIATLESLLPKAESKPKPQGFVLTSAMRRTMEAHRGQFLSVGELYKEIVQDAGGYEPLKKSVQITLSVWVKEGHAKKDGDKDSYMLV